MEESNHQPTILSIHSHNSFANSCFTYCIFRYNFFTRYPTGEKLNRTKIPTDFHTPYKISIIHVLYIYIFLFQRNAYTIFHLLAVVEQNVIIKFPKQYINSFLQQNKSTKPNMDFCFGMTPSPSKTNNKNILNL